MTKYIAIVASKGGEITIDQGFEIEAEALEHVAKHGGFVAPRPAGSRKYWVVDPIAKTLTHDQAVEDADILARAWQEIRDRQRALLAATDWRFRSDMTPSQDWINYCQALRDIPTNFATPGDVVWPVAPQ